MKNIFVPGLFSILFLVAISCNKVEDDSTVDIYVLEEYSTIDSTQQIDESNIVIRPEPLISYDEIISYNKSTYTFKISDRAIDSVENLHTNTPFTAFAVKVNEELIYTGYFWPSTSSMGCQWIVIDPLSLYSGNKLTVRVAYPGQWDEFEIPDNRNDDRILGTFRKDGKLKK